MKPSLDTILKLGEKHGFSDYGLDFADDYGEPGYTAYNGNGVIMANWNEVPSHIQASIERNYVIEWSDEWVTAHIQEDGKPVSLAYRCQADSYSWTPSMIIHDGEVYCDREAQNDPETYITDFLLNNPDHGNLFLNLTDHGFTKVDFDGVTGLHGDSDNPQDIMEELEPKMPGMDFAFQIDTQEQFQTLWSVYARPETYE